VNLIQALANYPRVASPELPYGWFAYDENGELFRYGVSGTKARIVCTRNLLERNDYCEYKPTLRVVSEPN